MPHSSKLRPSPSEKVILCIDDEEISLGVRRLLLEIYGYRVLTADSGRTALELLRSNAVDAVVLEYRMPDMDGAAVARQIRRAKPKLPIVLVSGYLGEIPRSLLRRVDAFVAKGEPPAILVEHLTRLLGEPKKRPPSRVLIDKVILQKSGT